MGLESEDLVELMWAERSRLGEDSRLGGYLGLGLQRDWRVLRRGRGGRELGDTFRRAGGVGGLCRKGGRDSYRKS